MKVLSNVCACACKCYLFGEVPDANVNSFRTGKKSFKNGLDLNALMCMLLQQRKDQRYMYICSICICVNIQSIVSYLHVKADKCS